MSCLYRHCTDDVGCVIRGQVATSKQASDCGRTRARGPDVRRHTVSSDVSTAAVGIISPFLRKCILLSYSRFLIHPKL